MYLIFDTETTGFPIDPKAPLSDVDNWPRLVQLAWQLHTPEGKLLEQKDFLVRPEGFDIPFDAQKIHGISTEMALAKGQKLTKVLSAFTKACTQAQCLVGHNIQYDNAVIDAELLRHKKDILCTPMPQIDTMEASTEWLKLSGGQGGKYKFPKLSELYAHLFQKDMPHAHHAAFDVEATAKSFFALLGQGIIGESQLPTAPVAKENIHYEAPDLSSALPKKEAPAPTKSTTPTVTSTEPDAPLTKESFFHTHVHSQYSVLRATLKIEDIVRRAQQDHMPAVALTDFGNMYGVFAFVKAARKANIKPIVGMECYVSEDRKRHRFTRDDPDKRFQQVLLAKNMEGYRQLVHLSSLGYTEGLYGQYPRIDKDLLVKHKTHLIALSGGLEGELPQSILRFGEKKAETKLSFWKETFGNDFYLELLRQGTEEHQHVNEVLLRWSEKHKIKYVAANEVFYGDKEDAQAQETLRCIRQNMLRSELGQRGRQKNAQLQEHNFKSQTDMKRLFADLPKAITHLQEVNKKCEDYSLERPPLLPASVLPKGFSKEQDYLEHLSFEGAKNRYGKVPKHVEERLHVELKVVENMGFPGYFLIIHEIISQAKKMEVFVGPGRGSVAGSLIAYCLGITEIDPLTYGLLFERFLNPDRISLPDIDIDFDDEGRDELLSWIVEKYGKDCVAQIITYGTMGARSAIRDCARVLGLPLNEAIHLSKLVPEKAGTTLAEAYEKVEELKDIRESSNVRAQVLKQAESIEGSVRHTGVHACGLIISPQPIWNIVPVSVSKKTRHEDMLVTQYDNEMVEEAGMLKMDLLGLKTLSMFKRTLKLVQKRHDKVIQLTSLDLKDKKTYALFQKGETHGVFQFESSGMKHFLRQLKPDRFEDLIAMNALYRPGPLDYIPDFIQRKHGKARISYDLPDMQDVLSETYGITVYQEQVMKLSQVLAGFSAGEADTLRKAMGKKKREVLDKLKPQFIKGATQRGHPQKACEEVWKKWEAFAQYAFNKSHATCYALIAYQTAYLKAHYPAEYMASILSCHQHETSKIKFFVEECRHLGLRIHPPNINTSELDFSVQNQNEIHFALAGIKGLGEGVAQKIVEERTENGPFKDVVDFTQRLGSRVLNKSNYEALVRAGALDIFSKFHRRQYLEHDAQQTPPLIEVLLKIANKPSQQQQTGIFSETSEALAPVLYPPQLEPFGDKERCTMEQEALGINISNHPIDPYQWLLKHLPRLHTLAQRKHDKQPLNTIQRITGIVRQVQIKTTRHQNKFAVLTLEDQGTCEDITFWPKTYEKYQKLLKEDQVVLVQGRWENSAFKKTQEFSVERLLLLGSLPKHIKSICLRLGLSQVDRQLSKNLAALFQQHEGTVPVQFCVEAEPNLWLTSTKYALHPTPSLFKSLDKLSDFYLKI